MIDLSYAHILREARWCARPKDDSVHITGELGHAGHRGFRTAIGQHEVAEHHEYGLVVGLCFGQTERGGQASTQAA